MWMNEESYIRHLFLMNYFPNYTTTTFKYCFAKLHSLKYLILFLLVFFCLLLDSYFTKLNTSAKSIIKMKSTEKKTSVISIFSF